MRRLVVAAFVSLDGVMQAPGRPDEDPDGGFRYGGWQVPHVDAHLERRLAEQFSRIGAVLLGRRTYELFAATWPAVGDDNPVAAALNRLPKYLASRTVTVPAWQHTTLLDGDAASAVAELKRTEGGEIHVLGSAELVQTLLRHGLVDEYQLSTFPVVLGRGKRLFGPGTAPTGLRLVSAETTPAGVVMHTYRPTGAPPTGAFVRDGARIARRAGEAATPGA